MIVVDHDIERELVVPHHFHRNIRFHEELLEDGDVPASLTHAGILRACQGIDLPGGDGVRGNEAQGCHSLLVGDEGRLPYPGLWELLPDVVGFLHGLLLDLVSAST